MSYVRPNTADTPWPTEHDAAERTEDATEPTVVVSARRDRALLRPDGTELTRVRDRPWRGYEGWAS
jgi:hypothetical protein